MSGRAKGGLLKWVERSFVWPAGAHSPPKEVRGVDFEGSACPWCREEVNQDSHQVYAQESASTYFTGLSQCRVCGWYLERSGWYNHSVHQQEIIGWFRLLKEFDLSDTEVTLDELGAHLKSHFADAYAMAPRRLESLVEDIFKKSGYRTRLTQQTRDGGADIFLMDDGADRQTIVEVKRYAKQRTIGVALVRQLLGAELLLEAKHGVLVTTSRFSRDAKSAAASMNLQGHSVELMDGCRLLEALSCYDSSVLPLSSLRTEVALGRQIPPEMLAPKRLLRAPWAGFYGSRVSFEEGDNASPADRPE